MQAMTLEVILRAVFGVSRPGAARAPARAARATCSTARRRRACSSRVLLARRFGGAGPLAAAAPRSRARSTTLLLAEIAERRADPDLGEREDILSLLVAARFEDGSGDGRPRAPRPADDAAARRPRDDRDRAGVDGRPAPAHPGRARAPARRARRGRATTYLRAVIYESLRLRPVVPLAGRRLGAELRADGLAAGRDRRHARDLADPHARRPLSRAVRVPARALPRARAEDYSWIPFGGGSRRCLGAAFAEFEMRVVLATVLSRCTLGRGPPAGARGTPECDAVAAGRHAGGAADEGGEPRARATARTWRALLADMAATPS